MSEFLPHIFLTLGALCSLLNFYLSFIRNWLHRLWGKECKFVSGVPGLGTIFLGLASIAWFEMNLSIFWLAIVLMLIDPGGLHVFIGVMFRHYFLDPQRNELSGKSQS